MQTCRPASSARSPRRWGSAGIVLTLLTALPTLGCDSPRSEPVRTEPWHKDEVSLSRPSLAWSSYRAAPGQSLTFSVHTKQGSVRGRVPISSAVLELDPQALDSARGEVKFDLEGLSLERVSVGGEEGAALSGDLLLSEAARLWLSLGPDVPPKQHAEARAAHFGIRLGRGLSSHSVQGGLLVPVKDAAGRRAGRVHRVSGIVEGDLLLLGREVTHVLKAEVDFALPRGSDARAAPERLVVRLSQPETVPLSEHGILPRDARGAVVTEQLAALGRGATLRALVAGSLTFERARE